MNKKYLFCFTYAGGTAAFYEEIKSELSDEVQVVPVEYSGHGKRAKEPLLDTMQETVIDLYDKFLKKYLENNKGEEFEYAMLGYSMGSIVVVECLRLFFSKSEIKWPQYIFLAAHQPKSIINLLNVPEDEVDRLVMERTVAFGGVPASLLTNKTFWRMYLPLYKADYLMIAKYNFELLDFKTQIPTTVFYSERDTALVEMEKWKKFFTGDIEFIKYDGNHFFINENYKAMAEVIKNKMEC